jgi:signal peptidase I
VKYPWLAVLFSSLFPGTGQIYVGAKRRGIFFVVCNIVLFLSIVLAAYGFLIAEDAATSRTLAIIAVAAAPVIIALGIYALFDAYKITKRFNTAHAQKVTDIESSKPWLAAFLSYLFPGIGQFYNRQVIKGIIFVVAGIVALILETLFIPLSIFDLLVRLVGIKDAFDSREALSGRSDRFRRQKRAILLFIVVMLSLRAIPFPDIIKAQAIKAYKTPSNSMYPTLWIGDHFLIGKLKSFRTSLKRGDIVVFPHPVNPEKSFVKRVIALGGDKVQIINGELYINDQLISATPTGVPEDDDQPYSKATGPPTIYEERIGDASYLVQYLPDKSAINAGPWLVPEDGVFVMGDNRNNSQDSRSFGPVPRNSIEGKGIKIYWSWNHVDGSVRWERIGKTIH